MSKLLIPNFTPVPNHALDEILPRLSKSALKVYLAVARKTYGFQKRRDAISFTQLQAMTGLGRGSVARGIKELGPLVLVTQGANRECNEYELNVEITTSELVSKWNWFQNGTSSKTAKKVVPKWNTQYKEDKIKKSTESDKQIPTSQVSSPKRRIKPASAGEPEAFTRWYQAFPRHEAREKALKVWRQINPDAALVETITAATSRYAAANVDTEKKYILHPATWLNDKRWQDELDGESSATGPPPFEDLGNDMVKAEGITMSRKTYERRYARSA